MKDKAKTTEKATRKAREKAKAKAQEKATESPVTDRLPGKEKEKGTVEAATTVALQITGYEIVLTTVESTALARISPTTSSTRIMRTPMTTRTTRGPRRTTKAGIPVGIGLPSGLQTIGTPT